MNTDWILSLDSDEEVIGKYFSNILSFCQNPRIGGIRLPIENILHDGTTSVHTYSRLFRYSATRAYKGAVHEQVAESIIAEGLEIIDVPPNTPAAIRHYGYAQNSGVRHQRNARLLQKALESEPESGYLWYHTGLTAFAKHDIQEAELALNKSLQLGGLSSEQNSLARLRLLQIALQRNDFQALLTAPSFNTPDHEGMRLYLTCIARLAEQPTVATTSEVYRILRSPLIAESPFVPLDDYRTLVQALERSLL
jgi:tetratricopeptide (TPR) repeat protein